MKADAIDIERWLVEYLSAALQLPPEQIRTDATFEEWGLESMFLLSMINDLADWLGRDVDTAIAYEHPTIAGLAAHLAVPRATSTGCMTSLDEGPQGGVAR
jgi:acyl carrier protein